MNLLPPIIKEADTFNKSNGNDIKSYPYQMFLFYNNAT